MPDQIITSVIVVGGGPAGWLTAGMLARVLRGRATIQLVDDGQAASPAATELATLPALRALHEILGIDENDLLRRTGGTFRLGTLFDGWSVRPYFHPFGEIGANLNGTPFHNHWLKLQAAGDTVAYADYSVAGAAAQGGKFARPAADKRSVLSTLNYGYHLDTQRYTNFLRELAERLGVARIDDSVRGVTRDGDTGFVAALELAGGRSLGAELYVDCDGALMDALGVEMEDWSVWLGGDRIVSVASEPLADLPPFTCATATAAGWQWRIPLRDRTGNGHVYSRADMSDADAEAVLLAGLQGQPRGDIRRTALRSGRRSEARRGNVVAIGPGACTLDPLEGTALHLVQIGLNRLQTLFPDKTHSPVEAAEYNRVVSSEFERLRDLLVLHYHATGRDEPFWRRARDAALPELLARKLTQFESRGRIVLFDEETFLEHAWAAVMIGQGIVPRRVDPFIDSFDVELLRGQAQRIRSVIRQGADSMPSHRAFLEKFCGAR